MRVNPTHLRLDGTTAKFASYGGESTHPVY